MRFNVTEKKLDGIVTYVILSKHFTSLVSNVEIIKL